MKQESVIWHNIKRSKNKQREYELKMDETCDMMMRASSIFCLTQKQICSMIFYRLDSLHCKLNGWHDYIGMKI